ncbi:HEAT repeat domain-containing protein [Pararobbsia silviterrae]|uniref:HEAT repeat domain-containing protein n=1 Tax=Pararobbsia silviterrae TaxID=1792498 RepID=A0A494Y168_9BURK|nr:HEAT repeat domain-containing protein [Pararobbsia silviterrae]RKP55989.1 HEAT repeat domain-containing protein [Pararobbsia silviterrae]
MTDLSDFLDTGALPAQAGALIERFRDADPAVRRIALLDLADIEDPALVPVLIAALRNDPSADVRFEAAQILAAWEQAPVVEALCTALLDNDRKVREAAAQSLSELKDPDAAAVLRRWVEHADPFVKQSALRGLRELRDADAFDPALAALANPHSGVRLEAVSVLGWLKDPRALAGLAALATTDTGADVRRAAVGALGFAPSGDRGVAAALIRALRDDAWQVREEAATTLGKLRAPATAELIAALDDDYWQVRLRATRALGQLRDADAAPAVTGLLTHTISNLRKEAALALGEFRIRASLDALRTALEDPDPEVRKAVRIAIQQIEEATA